mgnify:FL=1
MIAPPAGTRIWIAAGVTDMRRGYDGMATVCVLKREVIITNAHTELCKIQALPDHCPSTRDG